MIPQERSDQQFPLVSPGVSRVLLVGELWARQCLISLDRGRLSRSIVDTYSGGPGCGWLLGGQLAHCRCGPPSGLLAWNGFEKGDRSIDMANASRTAVSNSARLSHTHDLDFPRSLDTAKCSVQHRNVSLRSHLQFECFVVAVARGSAVAGDVENTLCTTNHSKKGPVLGDALR